MPRFVPGMVIRKGSPVVANRFAMGRKRPVPGQMNKTEQAYALFLETQLARGEIWWWRYEGVKLKLADNTFYTPDFNVMVVGGMLEMHETKGKWEDDARVKIKVAAEQYPFRFRAFKKVGSGWSEERFID